MLLFKLLSNQKDRLDLDNYALHLEYDVKKATALLNEIVDDAVTEWTIFNIRTEKESYITDERRNDLLEWVIRRVFETTSDAVREQIGIRYPTETQEDWINTIKNNAVLKVMNLVIQQNTKDMTDNIPNVNIQL